MRLAHFTIRNYKGINELSFSMPTKVYDKVDAADFLSIIGPNNTGKSSILQALALAMDGENRASIDEFRDHKKENPIEVDLTFDSLTTSDRELQAIRSHIHNGQYRICKRWVKTDAVSERHAWGPEYIFDIPSNPKKFNWRGHPEWKKAIDIYEKSNAPFKPNNEPIEAIKRIAVANGLKVAVPKGCSWVEIKKEGRKEKESDDDWNKNPGGISSNLASAMPRVIFVPALQETKKEAEVTQKNSSIRQIVSIVFQKQFDNHGTMQRLKYAIHEVSRLFRERGKDEIIFDIEEQITKYLMRIVDVEAQIGFNASLESISADLVNKTEFRLRDRYDSEKYGPQTWPEYHGHGVQRALILSLLQVLADQLEDCASTTRERGLILLVEEPEIYLHPEMCRKMRDTLLRIASDGRAQVICTTHSPIFLDLADRHDGIAIIRKSAGVVTKTQRIENIYSEKGEERDRLRMVLNFDPHVNEVFFTDQVCLVEGDTEAAAFNAIAEKLIKLNRVDRIKYQIARRRLVIVNCRGKWTIPAFQRVLNAFDIHHRVMHDSDSAIQSENSNLSQANEVIRSLIKEADKNLRVHNPNFEKALLGREASTDKPWAATKKIEKLDDVSKEMLDFFEFLLGKSTAEIAMESAKINNAVSYKNLNRNIPPRRNTREQLRYIEVHSDLRRRSSCGEMLGIAAGPGRIEGLDAQTIDAWLLPGRPKRFIAKIVGQSMLDTLEDGEQAVFSILDDVKLHEAQSDEGLVDIVNFKQHIKSDGIYVLAINDDIEENAYTIKRVRIEPRANGEWLCRIIADNSECGWGFRGEIVIRRTDRVHFAAELVGLCKSLERPGGGVEMTEVSHPFSQQKAPSHRAG